MGVAMAGSYLVRPLARDQIHLAFPLVSMFDVGLTMEQWLGYASALTDVPHGPDDHQILSVQSGQGHIYGVSAYWLKPDLRRERILEIENFAVVDMTGTRRVARVLLDGLEDLARQQNCNCIVISLLNPVMRRYLRDQREATLDLFKATGFSGDQMRLRKCFENGF
jgi:hypothetical protein